MKRRPREETQVMFEARRKRARTTALTVGAGSVAIAEVLELFLEYPSYPAMLGELATPPGLVHLWPLFVGGYGVYKMLMVRGEAVEDIEEHTDHPHPK